MTIHTDSEPEYEESLMVNPSGEKEKKRDTTVLSLHSDPEYDPEDNQEMTPLNATSIIFGNELSRITSDESRYMKFGGSMAHDSADTRSTNANGHNLPPFDSSGQKTSEGGFGTIVNNDSTAFNQSSRMGPVEMLNQYSGINQGGTETAEAFVIGKDSDLDPDLSQAEKGSHNAGSKNTFETYLLAPMGFDDDEGLSNSTYIEGYPQAAERFQMFAGVNEFDESDHLGLEENPYQVIPKGKRREERILENKRKQGKLLLVSLLENFCLLYDQNPERSNKLFYVICKTLSNMGIIDEEYLEEMSAARSAYQQAFRSLVLSALTSIKQEQMTLESRRIMAPPSTPTEGDLESPNDQYPMDSFSSKSIMSSVHQHIASVTESTFPTSTAMMRTISFGDIFDNDHTRYKHDFVEVCKLGKGGFASVFRAKNKLDGIEYAIKKIRLRGTKMRYEKIFREIKFLARLDHKNVVRYYSSWLEHADYPVSKRAMHGDNGAGDFNTHGDLDDEYDDEYMDEEECTNTISKPKGSSMPNLGGRGNVDYFGSHWGQHPSNLDDLSMGIVFGADEDEGDGISFEDSRMLDNLDGDNSGPRGSVCDPLASMSDEDIERAQPASTSFSSRHTLRVRTDEHDGYKDESSVASPEIYEEMSDWKGQETSSFKARNGFSNSYSALSSSSIEEIQRSLPSSYSRLGSRYDRTHHRKDKALAPLMDEHELQQFPFPNASKEGFIRSEPDRRCGMRGNQNSQKHPQNNTGQLIARDLTLFIQMQLCQTTLQDYLVYRNERPMLIPRLPELNKLRKASGFSILSSSSGSTDQKTHSASGSPLEQTCHKDLVDPAVNRHIFRAIVEGVAYIHDQDMIHRDLKPSNIFLGISQGLENQRRQEQSLYDSTQVRPLTARGNSGSIQQSFPSILLSTDPTQHPLTKEQIQEELFMNIEYMVPKIGDFGLVTDIDGGVALDGDGSLSLGTEPGQDTGTSDSGHHPLRRHSSSATTGSRSSRTRTTAVGTVTYASPEQLARPNLGYDQKADIYSLGIIFFELYHPFSTLMERHAVLRTLRRGELPPDFVSRWPKEAAFVLWLMAENPRMRPTAHELLEFDLIRKPKEEPIGSPAPVSTGNRTKNSECSMSPAFLDVTDFQSKREPSEALRGHGLDTISLSDSNPPAELALPVGTGKILCEACRARCQCQVKADDDVGSFVVARSDQDQPGGSPSFKDHHPSISISSKTSRSELKQRLKEESEKVKRLEMSMAEIRADNKALLDRIEELENERISIDGALQ
ncbi:Eukaryotic translation initiation factor 2-alpha kinase [Modicella reniformis]|uniref:Eukaryotic translation initiation factor 2-alpha kinase 1 n=1 Tax=Modicella reniformis TaxID=1440133 RepID=A0A9P6SUU7_9FUNG|nr:Eukaryotic translation initiation factor 2-alpha kinase [Modicella reniformis]